MRILVTGGAGFIGSHTCVELLNAGYEIVVADDLSNSKTEALDAIKKITGKDFPFYKIDIRDRRAMEALFAAQPIDAVIHFAGYKAVGESVQQPIKYYDNNLYGFIVLAETMAQFGVKKLVTPQRGVTAICGSTKYMDGEHHHSFLAVSGAEL